MESPGGVIKSVEPGSLGQELGLEPGDRVTTVDGHPLRDVLDYRFHLSAEKVEVEVRRADGQVWLITLEKDPDETLGVTFQDNLFDGIRQCRNRCRFCFVDQMPSGLRSSLYIKDDDYRLSFLSGNFVTLTNLLPGDMDRIVRQRLSPLYVSVHATDPQIRSRLLGSSSGPPIMEILEQLAASGITVHTQVVVVPGVNDGAVLEETLEDLASLHPAVRSVGVVPVGLTRHRSSGAMEPVDRALARETVRLVAGRQEQFMSRLSSPFAFLADEFYLKAGEDLPPTEHYGSFSQLENGVGLWSLLESQFRGALNEGRVLSGIILTGKLAAPLLSDLLAERAAPGSRLEMVPVENRWLGPTVTVAGLIGGRDVIRALKERDLPGGLPVYLPASALREMGQRREFLDGLTLEEASRQAEIEIAPVAPTGEALARALLREAVAS